MSVWDEKPEFPLDFTTEYEHYKGLIKYWQQKNDAWLEKLKAHYDRLEGIVGALEEMGVLAVYDMEHWSTDYAELKEKAEKWDELCECLRWGKNTKVETILMMFNAVNTGNQLKRKKLEAVKDALTEEYWGPRGVPTWNKPSFTAYDYEDGDAKNAVNRIAKILEAEK